MLEKNRLTDWKTFLCVVRASHNLAGRQLDHNFDFALPTKKKTIAYANAMETNESERDR